MSRFVAIGGALKLSGPLRKQIFGAAANSLEGRFKRQAAAVATAHYANALQQVSSVLSGNGAPSTISSSGGKSVGFQHVNGARGRVVTENWDALSRGHIRRSPVSTLFWRKTGKLSQLFNARIASQSVHVGFTSSKVVSDGKISILVNLRFSPLAPPFEALITQSLVHGEEVRAPYISTVKRNSVERVIFLEQGRGKKHRPFVARVSALLGRQMRSALQKLK